MNDEPCSSEKPNPGKLAESLKAIKSQKGLPPVHDWNPDFCGDIDMEIKRDGSWHYMGSPIARESMVKLFSTILRYDDDGKFYLVTPVEKVGIRVESAPFVVTQVKAEQGRLVFTTNVGDQVVLDEEHLLRMGKDASGHDLPFIRVRDRLDGLIHRNVYYQLLDLAVEKNSGKTTTLYLKSGGKEYYFSSYTN